MEPSGVKQQGQLLRHLTQQELEVLRAATGRIRQANTKRAATGVQQDGLPAVVAGSGGAAGRVRGVPADLAAVAGLPPGAATRPSPFSVAERELIAAYVSGLNACDYCHGVHTATAQAFGVDEQLVAGLLDDLDAAPVEGRMKPILRYVRKLTQTPSRMTTADAEAVFAAGWDEHALHDAVSVCALFNLMNRLVEGLGIRADAGYFAPAATRLASHGYAGLLTPPTSHGVEQGRTAGGAGTATGES